MCDSAQDTVASPKVPLSGKELRANLQATAEKDTAKHLAEWQAAVANSNQRSMTLAPHASPIREGGDGPRKRSKLARPGSNLRADTAGPLDRAAGHTDSEVV